MRNVKPVLWKLQNVVERNERRPKQMKRQYCLDGSTSQDTTNTTQSLSKPQLASLQKSTR